MSSEAELKAKIAALSGKIDHHKQQRRTPAGPTSPPQYSNYQHRPPFRSTGHGWAPYSHGGRNSYPAHKNRTLVLNGQGSATSTPPNGQAQECTEPGPATGADSAGAFVSMRGMNKQLMSKETFEREARQKLERRDTNRAEQRRVKDRDEKSKLAHHIEASATDNSRILEIDGVRFRLQEDGSKLMRISEKTPTSKETPKRTMIAGVGFLRTKNGNLIRATVANGQDRPPKRAQCQNFTKNGNCPFGPNCRFDHDPSKVAICKDFLHGTCTRGENCDLSHEPTYHRVSACTHFLRGNCTNVACRYPHINVSPAAPVCRSFATRGYCAKGPECDKRHVIECPDYANNGHCADRESGKCVLPHPDRASTLRKAAQRQARLNDTSEHESDLSSDNEQAQSDNNDDADDVDSDDLDLDVIMGHSDNETHALTQQQDFVAF